MDPATAIAAANAAVGIIEAFSSRGDGGLVANLRALQEKLDVVVNGIGVLERELGNLAVLVREQAQELEELPSRSFGSERLWSLQGCAGLFAEELSGSRATSPYPPPVTDDLRVLRNRVRAYRSDLSFSEPGRSALGALAALTAFALEISLETIIEGRASLRPILVTYVSWTSGVLDPTLSGSATAALEGIKKSLDAEARDLLKTAGISSEGLLPATAQGAGYFSRTYCHQEWWPEVEEILKFNHNPDVPPLVLRPHRPEAWGLTSTVRAMRKISYATADDIRAWNFVSAELGVHTEPGKPDWWPEDLAACQPGRFQPKEVGFAHTQAEADKRAADMAFGQERKVPELVMPYLSKVNLLEQRAAFQRRAIRIANTLKVEAENWLAVVP